MDSFIIPFILGIFIILLGISNMKGNISTIHWYHRKRVTEENKKPFGKLVGLGTIIIGTSLSAYSILCALAEKSQLPFLESVGSVLLIAALLVGLFLSFWAMIKYNHGIF